MFYENWVAKIQGLENQSLWQRINSIPFFPFFRTEEMLRKVDI